MSKILRDAAEGALRTMLSPIVRFWINHLGSIQRFVGILKEIFVQVAVEEIKKRGEQVTISRISIMTGLHRLDVTKIYRGEVEHVQSVPDVVTRVIGHWEQSRAYTNPDGSPRILSIKGRKSEFAKLVATVSKSIGPPSVLYELERTGVIEIDGDKAKLVYPLTRSVGEFDRLIELTSKNVGTMFSSIDENIRQVNKVPHHFIRTEYDNVLVGAVPEIRAWINREGKKFHKRVREYLASRDQDISPVIGERGGARVVVAGFSWVEEPEKEALTVE
ncbi:MAG: hypothetical protein KDD66_17640 [Bdellovibrionales bacterium]|nr:hypothetical protein [Bdellovibrionales bacterium]